MLELKRAVRPRDTSTAKRMQLPDVPSPIQSPDPWTWQWSSCGNALSVCYGEARLPHKAADACAVVILLCYESDCCGLRHHRLLSLSLPRSSQTLRHMQAWDQAIPDPDPGTAGIIFVQCGTGAIHTTPLPSQAVLLDTNFAPICCGWSPAAASSRLLVKQAHNGVASFVLYSLTGQQLTSLASPLGRNGRPAHAFGSCFRPDGEAVALNSDDGLQEAWIWLPSSGILQHLDTSIAGHPGEECSAWSPCSRSLLLLSGGPRVLLQHPDGAVLLPHCGETLGVAALGVGCVAAMFKRSRAVPPVCYKTLCLFGPDLTPTHTHTLTGAKFMAETEFQLAISRDGAHLLAVSCCPTPDTGASLPEPGPPYFLHVFCMTSRAMLQQHLLSFSPFRLRWLSDSTAACEDYLGSHLLLLSFA